MKILFSFFIIIFFSKNIFAVETLEPKISYFIDISPIGKQELNRGIELFDTGPDISDADKLLQEKYDKFVQAGSGFEFGCSWYCGGAINEIISSSALSSQNSNKYTAINAHDHNLDTAWVEGKEDYGIGEYIEYKFAANTPRVTSIYIYNGYMKSKTAWEDNSRVKSIKLYFDNKPYKVLNLEDNTGIQVFDIGTPFQSSTHPAYSLKFIISEVYPGRKYRDTAISEIALSGLDVHCVNSGSRILLGNGKETSVERIKDGDEILVYAKDKNEYLQIPVIKVKSVTHNNLFKIITESSMLEVSSDHPMLADNNEVFSINKYGNVNDLLNKKIAIYSNGKTRFEKIKSINEIIGSFKTYTFIINSNDSLFFIANNIHVMVEE